MRFSLKWILVGVTYVAVSAAAFSQQTWVYSDILWAVGLLAVVYGALLAIFARGRRQAAAAGFVVGSLAFAACVFAGSSSVPTYRLLTAAGLGPDSAAPTAYKSYTPSTTYSIVQRPVTVQRMTPNGPVKETRVREEVVARTTASTRPVPSPVLSAPVTAPAYQAPMVWDLSMYVRAGNAVGTMLFGGLGMLLGLAAYKAARRDDVAAQ